MTWASYRQEYKKYSNLTKQYAQITEEKKKIAEQEAMLKNKIHIISSANDQCCKLIGQLNSLNKACTKDINLSSFTLAPDGATITLNCPTIEHAQACSKAMAQSRQFTDLKITSICPTKQSITITLKTAIQGK